MLINYAGFQWLACTLSGVWIEPPSYVAVYTKKQQHVVDMVWRAIIDDSDKYPRKAAREVELRIRIYDGGNSLSLYIDGGGIELEEWHKQLIAWFAELESKGIAMERYSKFIEGNPTLLRSTVGPLIHNLASACSNVSSTYLSPGNFLEFGLH